MKILVVGSGFKENAIVWKLSQNPGVEQIYCTPGNPGIAKYAQCVDIKDNEIERIAEFAEENKIDLTIATSQIAIFWGIVNHFTEKGLQIFGPTKEAAKLESSKSFLKKFLHKNKIPTCEYHIFSRASQAVEYAKDAKYPLIIKYDTRSEGRGVFLCDNFSQAKVIIEKSFESLCKSLIIEKYEQGKMFSLPIITDGYNAVPLSPCFAYKRALEGNAGVFTSGMGAYAPIPFMDATLEGKIAEKIVFPLIDALIAENLVFSGILSIEMILDEKDNPKVMGVNSTISDMEAMVSLPLLETDLYSILYSTTIGALGDEFETFEIYNNHSVAVVLTSGGYISEPAKGAEILGLDNFEEDEDDLCIFQSDTKKNICAETVVNGTKVIAVASSASTLHRACSNVYDAINEIDFKNKRYRRDIVKNLVKEDYLFM